MERHLLQLLGYSKFVQVLESLKSINSISSEGRTASISGLKVKFPRFTNQLLKSDFVKLDTYLLIHVGPEDGDSKEGIRVALFGEPFFYVAPVLQTV